MRAPAILAILIAGSLAGEASAASLILGGGRAKACFDAARAIENRGPASAAQIATCDEALQTEALSVRDRAGTFVNRGILHMSRKAYEAALVDYSQAIRLAPDNGVAHVNRGAALIALERPDEGVEAIDQGLALNAEQPEKAYFNRGYGREMLGDVKGAYLDFTRASELRPDWELPRQELSRFTVHRPGEG